VKRKITDITILDPQKKGGRFRPLISVFKILVSVSAIVWLVFTVNWNTILEQLADVDWMIAGVALAIFSFTFVPCSLRWRRIAEICGYPMTFGEVMRWHLISSFFNVFLPTGKGGDVVRGILAAKSHGFSLAGIMGTILVERFIGLLVTVCLAISACLVAVSKFDVLRNVLVSMLMLTLFLATLIFICLSPRFRKLFIRLLQILPLLRIRMITKDVFEVLDTCRANPHVILSAVGFSLLNQLSYILAGFVLSRSIPDFYAPWFSFPVVIPLIFIAMLLPSIGGYGIREASFVVFFGWFGVNEEAAVVYSILQLLTMWAFTLVGAIIFVVDRPARTRSEKLLSSELQQGPAKDLR
jgi:uncharacterized protein (TIRG00374 family)